ncbi:hypothetical protein HPP92_000751 [Vanilla planifolia]|uniref:Cytochrome b5 heme-binding domain-containing protein n=1 Tax=Vanilla planifolia TaxID=51239 RepID=A0A835VHC8_VANPL|nr:hypothetical protein HPP92_000892 [Vanilla planifolia]KAG0500679.1 hypothetical protein HPP92_000751 [Vanilla planifolia]
MPTLTKLYSMREAAQHNKREDCWVVIDGKVYDVTTYLDEHPGGDDVLLSATGKDATEEFEDAGHSDTARKLMEDYCIGEIEKPTINVIPELEIFTKDNPQSSTKFLDSPLLYWVLPATIVCISAVAATVVYSRRK